MNPFCTSSYPALFTDLYELTMAEGYYCLGKHGQDAVFDYFFRRNPFEGGYTVFCGLSDLLEQLENFRFPPESLEYLSNKGFRKEFLDYLAGFRFAGNVWSVEEGEIVFPNEMILRVEGNILEAQMIETLVLNILNFESLIATKASRIRRVAGDRAVMDFGLRRAQGMAGLQASRAAYIGGLIPLPMYWPAFCTVSRLAGPRPIHGYRVSKASWRLSGNMCGCIPTVPYCW